MDKTLDGGGKAEKTRSCGTGATRQRDKSSYDELVAAESGYKIKTMIGYVMLFVSGMTLLEKGVHEMAPIIFSN